LSGDSRRDLLLPTLGEKKANVKPFAPSGSGSVSDYPTNRELIKSCDKTPSMANLLKVQNAAKLTATFRILFFLAVVAGTGCTTLNVRSNFVPLPDTLTLRTLQVFASSSIGGRPMDDDPSLRNRLAEAFQKQFPGARIVESQPDMVVFLTIVDYVPGCLPDCKKFRTYRSWSCEVMSYARESTPEARTMVFNVEGASYNPFYNQASDCASQLSKMSGSSKRVQTPD
jgi:hypothetical protein